MGISMQWPNDVDGDVMRRLAATGFDFDRSALIDFNIDFDTWPPPDSALQLLEKTYRGARLTAYAKDRYVLLQVEALVTYELVVEVQRNLCALMSRHGGKCDSWGVLYDPRKID